MRADARVKWRFRRSAVVVSLRDDSEFRDFVGFWSRASLRDAIPSALRLPRPRCGLAMTQKRDVLILETNVYCFMRPFRAVLFRTVFQAFRSENRFVFQKTLSDLSLRGGRVRPTRQSLTERNGIPERGTAEAAQ